MSAASSLTLRSCLHLRSIGMRKPPVSRTLFPCPRNGRQFKPGCRASWSLGGLFAAGQRSLPTERWQSLEDLLSSWSSRLSLLLLIGVSLVPFCESTQAYFEWRAGFEAGILFQSTGVRVGHRHIARLHRSKLFVSLEVVVC